MKKYCLLVALLLLTFLSQIHSQGLYQVISEYNADQSTLSRKYTNTNTVEYLNRMDAFFADWQKKLTTMDFDQLDKDGKIDFLLLQNDIARELDFLKLDRQEFNAVANVIDFADSLHTFTVKRRRGAKQDAQQLAALFHKAAADVIQKQTALAKSSKYNSWQVAERASDVVGDLRKSLKEAYEFYYGYDIEFTWWVEKPYKSLDTALEKYGASLKDHYTNTVVKDDGSGIIGKPIGRDAVMKSLSYEFIPYTPEELISIAEMEFAWCDKEMLQASRELGYGDDWRAAVEHVKNTYVPPGQWPQDVNDLAEEAIAYMEDNDLITIPDMAKESWRMVMLSPEWQLTSPFFLGGEQIMIAYPTNTMDHDAKMMSMRGNNPYFSRATVQHELIPGHHLQQFSQQRYKPYRRMFGTPFWMEGWALYWEFNLWDKGFPRTPEEKIGMLFWRMHRCARIIFSLNYHLNKMTPQQCIDFLVDRVGHERANAEAEVRRSFTGRYGPLYQIAYMVGGLQFYQLKQEMVASGKMTERDFHDAILKENSMPVALVRAILTDAEVTKDKPIVWKFYQK
jgi:uncharacterized protein (DUF885 family)